MAQQHNRRDDARDDHILPPGAASRGLIALADPIRLLTFDEVAAVLRTSRKAVYAMRARGHLPPTIKIGRRVLIREADLLAWLAERRVVSPMESRR